MDSSILLEQISSLGQEIQKNSKLLWAIGALLLTDIILVAIRIIADYKIKQLEKNILKFNLRESKRIEVYEEVYRKMNDLTFILYSESSDIISKISEIDRFKSEKYLYIENDAEKVLNDFCDYYRKVATDYRQKDNNIETQKIADFKNCFNK